MSLWKKFYLNVHKLSKCRFLLFATRAVVFGCVCNQLLPLIKKIPGSQLTASALFQLFFFLGRLHIFCYLMGTKKSPKGFCPKKSTVLTWKSSVEKAAWFAFAFFFPNRNIMHSVQHSVEGNFQKRELILYYFSFKLLPVERQFWA